jgi:hypothetical protein
MKNKIMKEKIMNKTTLPVGFFVCPCATRMYGSLPSADAPDFEYSRNKKRAIRMGLSEYENSVGLNRKYLK